MLYEDSISYGMKEPSMWGIQGAYPVKENEIMVSSNIGKINNGEINIGEMITLNVVEDDTQVDKEFIVSGIFKSSSYDKNSDTCCVYVSEAFMKSHESVSQIAYFKCSDDSELVTGRLSSAVQHDDDQTVESFLHSDYTSEKQQVVAVVAVILILILISAFLLIYNVFYISLSQDVQAYGLLKTLGATGRQLKRVVYAQFFRLGTVGAVIGIGIGLLLSMVGMPYLISRYSDVDASAYWGFRYMFLIFIVIFTFLAVYISARKPARIIASLTAVESVRYMSGSSEVTRKRLGSSEKHSIIAAMAHRSMTANRKRSALVIISLTLGLVIFMVSATVVNSMSADKYVNTIIDSTVEITNDSYTNDKGEHEKYASVNDAMAEKIKGFDGVLAVYKSESISYTTVITEDWNDYLRCLNEVYDVEIRKPGESVTGTISSISSEQLEKYRGASDEFIEKFNSGGYYFINENYSDYCRVPDKVEAVLSDGSSHVFEFGGYVNLQMFIASGDDIGICLAIPESEFTNICPDNETADTDILYVYAEKNNEAAVCRRIGKYLGSNKEVRYMDIEEVKEEGNFMIAFLNIAGTGTSFVFILLGIMNFINLMSASMQSRKSELSMLESIGMTKRQIVSMLVREGLTYSAVSIAVVLTAGYAFARYTVNVISRTLEFAAYDFQLLQVVGVCATVITISMLVPCLMYQRISKEELPARIRYE